MLLSCGVDPSIVSLQGYTAAQIAPESVQKLLLGKFVYGYILAEIIKRGEGMRGILQSSYLVYIKAALYVETSKNDIITWRYIQNEL